MKEKKYNKITVQDIADKAFINRNTFYLHYLDKEDLLEKLSVECFSKLKESMDSYDESTSMESVNTENLYGLTCFTFNALLKDADFYEMILVGEGIPSLVLEFTNLIKKHMLSFGKDDIRYVYVEFVTSGVIGIMRYWIQNRNKYSVEEISKVLMTLYTNNMIELLVEPSGEILR